MKTAWAVLLISALTDFIISFGNALVSAMVEGKTGELPSYASLLIASMGALVAFARTVQQGLKATPANSAELRGDPVTTVTKTPEGTMTTKTGGTEERP